MRIAILGTGAMAAALGGGWARAGHEVVVTGRTPERAQELAAGIGARAVPPGEAVAGADVVLLAVAHTGVADVLHAVGATAGALAGVTLIDPVNAVDHGGGPLRLPDGSSHAELVAAAAPGAHVVKAFHLFPSTRWTEPAPGPGTVPLCGVDAEALRTTGHLVRDLGAEPVVFGDLSRARQLEEAAGFVISLAFTGIDPATAVPSMSAAATAR
ncbi:NAD(P)-binding domain-containing protein [Nocardia sp. NPDC052254]|uniref:NADPH-dependent F420 reductase n=1 Tax=Nocardia sp. NPDC052254 TaxID=3155681 RepID=UPI00342DF5A8